MWTHVGGAMGGRAKLLTLKWRPLENEINLQQGTTNPLF